MSNNGNPLNKVDNTDRTSGVGRYKECTYYYHTFDADHGHMLFTEHALVEATERAQRKAMMIHKAVPADDPWWKVWA